MVIPYVALTSATRTLPPMLVDQLSSMPVCHPDVYVDDVVRVTHTCLLMPWVTPGVVAVFTCITIFASSANVVARARFVS
jgi:hypothetical protein